MKTLCGAARRLYPGARRCPQLTWIEQENRYKCGLMMIAGPVGQGYRKELYAGAGCSSSLNSWRQDVQKRDEEIQAKSNPLDPIFQIFIRELGRGFITGDAVSLSVIAMEKPLEEQGYSKVEIKTIQGTILHFFRQQRSSFMDGFMG